MPQWKVNLLDSILNILPILQIGRANRIGRKLLHLKNVEFGEAAIKHFADNVILANRLVCIDPVKDMVIPVDTMSKKKVDINEIDQAYKDGKVVIFYAAGKNSRYNEKGELRDRRWRTTFLEMAKKYNTPIHVMKIEGGNSPLFYKVSKFRERNKWLKNVPLENMFQLREIMEAKGILKFFISNPVFFANTPKKDTKQELRSKAGNS